MSIAIAAAFWLMLLGAYTIGMIAGDRTERAFAHILVIATLATLGCKVMLDRNAAPIGYITIDASLLLVAIVLVVKHDRFWPIWFAGFQLLTVAAEFARFIFPYRLAYIYGSTAEFWALPALGAFSLGTAMDHRARDASNSGRVQSG